MLAHTTTGRPGDVVFGVAAHQHVFRADAAQAFGIGFGLGEHAAEGLQGGGKQGRPAAVALCGLLGEAGVGQEHGQIGRAAGGQQVRPDFGFHDDAEARLMLGEEGGCPSRVVVGQVAALGIGKQALGGGAAGGRHLREQQRGIGKTAAQSLHQRHGGSGFAHRHGVHPNGVLHRIIRRLAKTLALMQQIGGGAAAALGEQMAGQRAAEEAGEQAVEGGEHDWIKRFR